MFCPNCGAKNDDDAEFCRSCGTRLTDSTQTSASAPAPPPKEGMKGRITSAFRQAVALVRDPPGYMTKNREARETTRWITVNYVAILAGVAFVGTLVGDLITFSHDGEYAYAIPGAILAYVLEILGFVIVGIVIWKLGPSFATNTTQDVSMRLSAYAYTPVFLAAIFYAIPEVGFIIEFLALLYGLYILYRGIPIMLGTPQDRVFAYLVVTLILVLVISVALSFVAISATDAVAH